MIIEYNEDGSVVWQFFRKGYRKARWRRAGERMLRTRVGMYRSGMILINYPPCNRRKYKYGYRIYRG